MKTKKYFKNCISKKWLLWLFVVSCSIGFAQTGNQYANIQYTDDITNGSGSVSFWIYPEVRHNAPNPNGWDYLKEIQLEVSLDGGSYVPFAAYRKEEISITNTSINSGDFAHSSFVYNLQTSAPLAKVRSYFSNSDNEVSNGYVSISHFTSETNSQLPGQGAQRLQMQIDVNDIPRFKNAKTIQFRTTNGIYIENWPSHGDWWSYNKTINSRYSEVYDISNDEDPNSVEEEIHVSYTDNNQANASGNFTIGLNLEYFDNKISGNTDNENNYDNLEYVDIDYSLDDGNSWNGFGYLRLDTYRSSYQPFSKQYNLTDNNLSLRDYKLSFANTDGEADNGNLTYIIFSATDQVNSSLTNETNRLELKIKTSQIARFSNQNSIKWRIRGEYVDRYDNKASVDAIGNIISNNFKLKEEVGTTGKNHLNYSVEEFSNQGYNRVKLRLEKFSNEISYDHLACLEIGKRVYDSNGNRVFEKVFAKLNHTASILGCADLTNPEQTITFSGSQGDSYRFTSDAVIDLAQSDNNEYWTTDGNGDVLAYVDDYFTDTHKEFEIEYYVAGSYWVRELGDVNEKRDIFWSQNISPQLTVSDNYTIPTISLASAQVSSTTNCVIDLAWTNPSTYGDANRNYVYIYRNNEYLDKVNDNIETYQDTNITAGETYTYQIASVYERNRGGHFYGQKSTALDAEIDLLQSPSGLASQQSGCDGNISLTWSYNINPANFIIQRKTANSSFITLSNTINGADRSYTDNNSIVQNEVYYYRIAAIDVPANCDAVGEYSPVLTHSEDQVDITGVFDNNTYDVEGSKGYFDNRTELEWVADGDFEQYIHQYKIYRRELGKTNSPKLLETLDINAKTYNDVNGNAGFVYEYFIIGERVVETACGRQVTASYPIDALEGITTPENLPLGIAYDIGIRIASGVVNGNIAFEGGTAVENVKVIAEKQNDTSGKSLYFNGTNSFVEIPNNETISPRDALTFSLWMKPEALNSYAIVAEVQTSYSFQVSSSGQIQFGVRGPEGDYTAASAVGKVTIGNWINVTGTFDTATDEVKLYINGKLENTVMATSFSQLNENFSFPLTIGHQHGGQSHYFQGYIDEVKLYHRALTADEVAREYSRFSATDADDLKLYMPIFEGAGKNAHDISHSGDLYYKNDGSLSNVIFTDDIPSSTQLGNAGYTDAFGNYTIPYIQYNGTGENFNIIPTATIGGAVHEFNPARKTVFIGEGNKVINGENFEDISSFRFSGYIRFDFEDTVGSGINSSGSEGVSLLLNGTDFIFDDGGNIYKTNEDGFFDVDIPIGNHFIVFTKNGHTFNQGRFPETNTHNFQEDITGLEILDETKLTLSGRVIGGLEEGNKKLSMPNNLSVNNIGTAKFTVSSEDQKIVREITTDVNTGEYSIKLPPKKYNVITNIKYVINNADIINSGDLKSIDLNDDNAYAGVYEKDTIYNNGVVTGIDSTFYNLRRDFILRNNPELLVTTVDDQSLINSGDEFYILNQGNGQKHVNLTSLQFPVYTPKGTDQPYQYKLKAVETYTNVDNSNNYISSVSDGSVNIFNGIGNGFRLDEDGNAVYNNPANEVITLDANGEFIYNFTVSEPNVAGNSSIGQEHLSFTKQIGFTLNVNNTSTAWPNPSDPNERYYAYVFGLLPIDTGGFVTKAPTVVDFILRDPPGSNSYAYINEETNIERTSEVTNGSKQDFSGQVTIGSGFYFSFGPLNYSLEAFGTFGGTETRDKQTGNEVTTSTKFTQTIETNSDPNQVGRSDIFVAKSENIKNGMSIQIRPIPVSLCGSSNCIGETMTDMGGNQYRMARIRQSFLKDADESPTYLIYSQNHIENVLIPDLEDIRNSIFTKPGSLYTSKLATDHPNFGINNDDPVWGSNVSTTNYEKTELDDFDGFSYKYTPIVLDSIAVDSVRTINQQIRLWKEALAQNEVEKWIAKNYGSGENISISGGSKIEKSTTTSISRVSYTSFEHSTSFLNQYHFLLHAQVNPITGVAPNYLEVDVSNEWTKTEIKTDTNSRSDEDAYGYVLHDSDEDDFMSVDIIEGQGNNGPIFVTQGGQTMCPYEDEVIMTYTTISYLNNLLGKANIDLTAATNKEQDYRDNGDTYKADKEKDKKDAFQTYVNRLNTLKSQIAGGKVILSNRTIQRDKPQILINGAKTAEVFNVPANEAANFNLQLINASESGDAQFYAVQALDETNPNGLEMTIDGQSINSSREFLVQGGGGIQKVLKVSRGPNHYDYENVGVVITSTCQADPTSNDAVLSDTIYFNAKYLPICTPLKINSPTNSWTVNNSFENKLPISIGDYDVNISGFEEIKLQYKPSTGSNWILLTTYYRNEEIRTDNGGSATDPLLPTNGNFFTYDWNLGSLPDGDYDIRAVSKCTLAENVTEIFSGTIDRTNPTPFGLPQPSDGILSSGEEISLQFNEKINANLLSLANFDIRGVLNGEESDRSESIAFAGTTTSFVEVEQIDFTSQPFTIDFYAKRDINNTKQVLISQGTTANESLEIGFNANNQIYFTLGNKTLTGNSIVNSEWHQYAFTYDPINKNLTIYKGAVLDGIDNSFEVNVNLSSSLFVGKSANNTNPFTGNVNELRIWSSALSIGEINIYATKNLVGNEPNLLHNWTMREAHGTLVLDKVRSKHALMNATWAVSPKGYALSLTGTQDQVITTPIAFTDESDFTVEFWVQANGTLDEVLVSNGKGDGTTANTSGWSIGINANGYAYAQSNGVTLQGNTIINDNQWYHVAIVVNARGNTVLFVNATEQDSVESSTLDGFGGNELSIGQRVAYSGTVRSTDKYFTGNMDEIRIWNAAISQTQLERDRYNRLTGDEIGLVRYYPFDVYTQDPINKLFSVTSTLDNAVENTIPSEALVLSGTTNTNQNTPTIKLPRKVRAVEFSYVVNNDKIIITLNVDPAEIENVALDFTASNIKDLNGNSIASPIKWTAFVDKNQVIWQDNSFDLITAYEEELVFETNIVNNSGESKLFEITNVPFWLSVSPTSGTVGPLTTTPITFTVSENVNIGDYETDILLSTTDFGFSEKLNIVVSVQKALPGDWSINPTDYEFSMNIIGQIAIDGNISRDANNILGVFVDNECRGMAKLTYVESYDNYQAFLAIYSDSSFGDDLEFRVWEQENGLVHSSLTHNLPSSQFTADTSFGTASSPELFSTSNIIKGSIDVTDGWRWISFNLNGTDLSSTDNALSSLTPADGDLIKTRITVSNSSGGFTQQSLFDTYFDFAEGWIGNLTNNGSLSSGLLYKIKTSAVDKIKYEGAIPNPITSPIQVVAGWNYIGYLGQANIPVNEALANFNANPGDLLKSQYFSAIYDPSFGWIGTLKVLSPNEGYMIRTTNEQSFTYPSFNSTAKTGVKSSAKLTNTIADSPWKINAQDFENNMTIVAEIDDANFNPNDGVLGAFINGECKGYAANVFDKELGKNLYFLNVGTRESYAKVEFKYLDFSKDIIYNINEKSTYTLDAQDGNIDYPKSLTLDEGTILGDLNIKTFPNPAKNLINVILPLETTSSVTLTVFDVRGKRVYMSNQETFARGKHQFTIDSSQFAAGVYNLQINTENGVANKKIVIAE